MATKGQQYKRYDLAFKQKVLHEYRKGYSAAYLSTKYDVPSGTIETWYQITKRHGGLGIAKKVRPTGKSYKDYKERYEILKKFRDFLVSQEQKRK